MIFDTKKVCSETVIPAQAGMTSLSSGSAADDPEGQKLMTKVPKSIGKGKPLLMDKA